MCGIAGFVNFHKDKKKNITKMMDRMVHRGPDAGGIWESEDGNVTFGHRRLAIVDLTEGGLQPMASHSGRFEICFNGEIYNYKSIADRLIKDGKVTEFRSTSDTEVLVEAIEAYGVKEAISLCKGMFGIAVYDNQDKVLYLLRDRIGEKPLYYGYVGESFVFASDIGSIAQLEGFDNPINVDVLDIYFAHGYIPAPYSIYRGINKQEPGTILTIKAPFDKVEEDIYWSVREVAKRGQENTFKGSFDEASEELERLLKESIKDQMMADVPVGAFLSAGIDSSTTVALMQSLASRKVRSFTIGMEEEGYNEADAAKEIAKHMGTEHTELYISKQDALDVIPNLAHYFSEPFADSSQIPTYLVSKMTREHVTVSLSGDGGDELFCGYTSYTSVDRIWGKISKIPYPIRKLGSDVILNSPLKNKGNWGIKGALLPAKGAANLYESYFYEDPIITQIALKHKNILYKYNTYEQGFLAEPKHNVMLMDMLMYHPDDILVKVDRSAMAVSLETRVPMLDKDVVEFAWSVPVEYKRNGDIGKVILRDVLYRYVPKELMDRPKKGFSIPISKWLKEPGLREWAESLLDPELIRKQGLLDPEVVSKIWKDYIERDIWRIQIWFLLMFQEWMINERTGLN